jgi:hypothetical protein
MGAMLRGEPETRLNGWLRPSLGELVPRETAPAAARGNLPVGRAFRRVPRRPARPYAGKLPEM